VYGLRAREFLDMQEKVDSRDRNEMELGQALALLTQLRWPLTKLQLEELLYPQEVATPKDRRPTPGRMSRLEKLLLQAAGWLSGVQHDKAPLQFGHQSLAEVSLAAWRLVCSNRVPLTEQSLVAEARAVDRTLFIAADPLIERELLFSSLLPVLDLPLQVEVQIY
jgi:hypothetical protein